MHGAAHAEVAREEQTVASLNCCSFAAARVARHRTRPRGPLDDQSGAELRQLRQRLTRILTNPDGEQLVDPLLNLRRWRYGASHGVGPPSSSAESGASDGSVTFEGSHGSIKLDEAASVHLTTLAGGRSLLDYVRLNIVARRR
ncbi:MAG: hypothetical protein LC777_17610 [Actinobacteria bacterium]|nr:hypothetical protein [Actinomycetota bacterium]